MALDITSYLLGKKGSGGGASGLKVVVVETLPQTGEANILYLVPKTTTGTNNVFEEYLYINNSWELIGTTDIDLSNYIQKSLTAGLVKNDGTIDTSTYLTQEVPEVYYVETSYNNPFVFDGKKKGIYYIIHRDTDLFNYKLSSTTGRQMLTFKRVNYIILNNDFNYNTLERNVDLGIIETYTTNGDPNTGYIQINSFKVTNNDITITLTNKTPYKLCMLTEYIQTISGVKTFSSIPQQSNTTAPTLDIQFTNKKYVDDSIANAIGTALGGSY